MYIVHSLYYFLYSELLLFADSDKIYYFFRDASEKALCVHLRLIGNVSFANYLDGAISSPICRSKKELDQSIIKSVYHRERRHVRIKAIFSICLIYGISEVH